MLTLKRARRDGQPVLELTGELNIYTVCQARKEILEHLEKHPGLALDLQGVEELDSAGVQLLWWLRRQAATGGGALPFRNHSPAVVEVFDLLGLAATFGDPILLHPSAS